MAKRLPYDHNGPPVFDSAADIPDGVPKMHYFKCDINALWDVLVEMPFDMGGFYMRAILSMYKHMEGLPADDNVARMRLGGIDIRTYRRMKAALLGHPKCFVEKPSGRISNVRFEEEISEYVTEFRNRQKAGYDTAEKQRIARATRPTYSELPADFRPTSGKSPAKVRETSERLPANISREVSKKDNEINEHATPIAIAVPSQQNRNEGAKLELEVKDRRKEESNSPPETPPAYRRACGPDDDGDIPGLNGATSVIVKQLAKWLNTWSPDIPTATTMVSHWVKQYGSDAVRDGFAEYQADITDGKVRVPSAKSILGFIQRSKTKTDSPSRQYGKPTEDRSVKWARIIAEKEGSKS